MEIAPSAFADEIDIQRSSISHILSGRNNPSLDVVIKILSKYPEIKSDWLLTGKGPMKQLNLFGEEEDLVSNVEQPPSEPVVQTAKQNLDGVQKKNTDQEKPIQETPIFKEEVSNQRDMSYPQQPKRVKNIIIFYEDGTFTMHAPSPY